MKNNPEEAENHEKIANHWTQWKQHQQALTIRLEYQQSTSKDIWAQLEYIQMGQASHVEDNNTWDLEETIRQAEQNFTVDLKKIATEMTNDE